MPGSAMTFDLPGQLQPEWEFLRTIAEKLGFAAVGVASPEPVSNMDVERYKDWINRGRHAGMSYMEMHQAQKFDPRHTQILANATALIAVALPYGHGASHHGFWKHVAAHARGRDYHVTLRDRLGDMSREVASRFSGCDFRIFVDTAPLMERYWAVRAGLGEIGRNGAIVVPGVGCRVLLGEIVVSGPTVGSFERIPRPFDLCCGCDRCLASCPTGAIISQGVVDSRRCISYHTVENRRGPIPAEIASEMRLVFGCDECTSSCPLENYTISSGLELPPNQGPDEMSIKEVADMQEDELAALILGTALERTGAEAIRRNARSILMCGGRRSLHS